MGRGRKVLWQRIVPHETIVWQRRGAAGSDPHNEKGRPLRDALS